MNIAWFKFYRAILIALADTWNNYSLLIIANTVLFSHNAPSHLALLDSIGNIVGF